MLKVDLNRIDGSAVLSALKPEGVSVRGENALIELWLSADHDIEVYFPAPAGAVRGEWLEAARGVLSNLGEMDNHVQRSCAAVCAQSGSDSRDYESRLAAVTLLSPDRVVLHYFGAVVNTSWDEHFARIGGQWVGTKPPEPGAALAPAGP